MTNQSSLDRASLPILQIYNILTAASKCRENNKHSGRCVELEGCKKFHLGGEAEKALKKKKGMLKIGTSAALLRESHNSYALNIARHSPKKEPKTV